MSSRKGILTGFSFFSGSIVFVLALAAFELAARGLFALGAKPLRTEWEEAPNVRTSVPDRRTHLAVHLPAKDANAGFSFIPAVTVRQVQETPYLKPDPVVGLMVPPGAKIRSKGVTQDGSVAYEVIYETDSQSRRITPGQRVGARSRPFLFFGGSFTFGVGVMGNQTIAAEVARRAPGYKIYNYGIPAAGPGNALRWLKTPGFGADIVKAGGTKYGRAVFIYIDNHILRVLGGISLERAADGWLTMLPYYYLDSKGQLQTDGMLWDGRPVMSRLYFWLSKSALLRLFNVDYPFHYSRADFMLFAKICKAIKLELKIKLGIDDFTVVIYPASAHARELIDALDAEQVDSLDYSRMRWSDYLSTSPNLRDGHPSAAADKFLGAQIVRDLGLSRAR